MIIVEPRETRLRKVHEWITGVCGEAVAKSPKERALRLLEEVLELAQLEGIEPDEVQAIADHVYSKPLGEAFQEVGGIGVTLLAYCATRDLDPDIEEQREIDRILSKSLDHFRARHQKKVDAGVAMSLPDYLHRKYY